MAGDQSGYLCARPVGRMCQGREQRVLVRKRSRAPAEEFEHVTGAFDRVDDWAADDDWPYWVQVVFKTRGDPEVSAAASDGPKQVGLLLVAGPQDLAVGGDELDRPQIIERQAVLAHQPAQPSAEG